MTSEMTDDYLSNVSEAKKYSSRYVPLTLKQLSTQILTVTMNSEEAWELETWHINVSFRKAGIFVPESAIQLPIKPIKGPDYSKESKEFAVKINNKEEVFVRCRLHHWLTVLTDKRHKQFYHWLNKAEPMFPEDKELLDSLPLPSFPKKVLDDPGLLTK